MPSLHLQSPWQRTLEQRDVVALLSRDSLSERVRGVDMSVRMFRALFSAFWKDSDMVVGWIPERSKDKGQEYSQPCDEYRFKGTCEPWSISRKGSGINSRESNCQSICYSKLSGKAAETSIFSACWILAFT